MSEIAEYYKNAQVCAAFAEAAQSQKDRAIWLRMSMAWRELAAIREKQNAVHVAIAANG
jgi:hypothetical protein